MIIIPEETERLLDVEQIDVIRRDFSEVIMELQHIAAETGTFDFWEWKVVAYTSFDIVKLAGILDCKPNEILIEYAAKKNISMKPRMELLPFDSLMGVAYVQEYGIEKHGENSWMQDKYTVAFYLGATLRHIGKHLYGCRYDESGYLNLAHAATDILFALSKELKDSTLKKNAESLIEDLRKYKE